MELISRTPTVFNHSPLGSYPEAYIAWEEGSYTVLVDPASTDDSLDAAYDHDKVLICFVGGDTLGVQLITGVRDICSWLQCAGQCTIPDDVVDELEAAWDARRAEMGDDVDFGDVTSGDVGTGRAGEPAYVMRVRHVGDATRLVPTRDILRIDLKSDSQFAGAAARELGKVRDVLLKVEGVKGANVVYLPVIGTMHGRDMPSLVFEDCHHLPLLAVILPDLLAADCLALANSRLMPVNVINSDSRGATPHYVFQGKTNELLLDRYIMRDIVAEAVACGELMVALVCKDEVWLRYRLIDSDWDEQDQLTVSASSVGSYEPAPEAAANCAADDAEPKRIRWYPQNIAYLDLQK